LEDSDISHALLKMKSKAFSFEDLSQLLSFNSENQSTHFLESVFFI